MALRLDAGRAHRRYPLGSVVQVATRAGPAGQPAAQGLRPGRYAGRAGRQYPLPDLSGRGRPAEVVPLDDVAAQPLKLGELRGRLDALRDDEQVEGPGEAHHHGHDRLVLPVPTEAGDEGPVHLERL